METQDQGMARDKQINFRLSKEEDERFEREAQRLGVSVTAMLRLLVKEKDEQFSSPGELAKRERFVVIDGMNGAIARAHRGEPPTETRVGDLALTDLPGSLFTIDRFKGYLQTFVGQAERLANLIRTDVHPTRVRHQGKPAELRFVNHSYEAEVRQLEHYRTLVMQEMRDDLPKM